MMRILKPFSKIVLKAFVIYGVFALYSNYSVLAQEVKGPHEIKWMRVGTLHNWFDNASAEVEYGRRGRTCCQEEDQADQLYWDAQYKNQDRGCSKGLWIGTTDFNDPVTGKTYLYKVVQTGPRFANNGTNFMPVVFKMVGSFRHPFVTVDGDNASENDLNDIVEEYDLNQKPDRMIINQSNTNMGITVTRKIMAFSQQNHDNYFIYDYVFKNTGEYNLDGDTINRKLTDVIFHFQYRYAPGWEARAGLWFIGDIAWGRNTVNQVVGQNPDDPIRALYSWYGPHSDSPGGLEGDWGAPNTDSGGQLGAPAFVGVVTLHADTSPNDSSDNRSQPFSTWYNLSDDVIESPINSYNLVEMTQQYNFMNPQPPRTPHPEKTHAEEVGNGFANKWGPGIGGTLQTHSFGPYTMEPGDSIHIVLAEGVAGLCRKKSVEVGDNWFLKNSPFTYPDPIPVLPKWMPPIAKNESNRNEYKKAWVWTAQDSLFQTFRRAIDNYESGYNIPKPPPPPETFDVKSGGDRISLLWDPNPEDENECPNFDGYKIFRAVGTPDASYDEIASCNKSNVENIFKLNNGKRTFEDLTARRRFDYYYYIQTKDDGTTNKGVPLVSSKFYTMTNKPAYLRRPAGDDLSQIRIVPNPYNIKARRLQFGQDTPDRIAFYGLPPICNIKIFTERGDLVKTIEHTDGSGDELWDSTTSSRQIVVSGLYIVYFEVTRDYIDPETGAPLFKKGDNTIRKFVIIR